MYCGDELVCDSGMCDEYHMTLSWLPALQSLLGKSRTAKLAPWEESDMELYLIEEGQRLILNGINLNLLIFDSRSVYHP